VIDDDDLVRVDELAAAAGEPVLALVEQLPEPQRDAVRSRVLEEREYPEMARELHCSELVARQRVSRGLARLRNELTERDR
jgi:RNA polymerase sigma-70 factor (ECF subfamily)